MKSLSADFFAARVLQKALAVGVPFARLVRAWEARSQGDSLEVETLTNNLGNRWSQRLERDCENSLRAGIVPVIWGSSLYPRSLEQIAEPPFLLEVLGAVDLLQHPRKLAVVGSRSPCERSLQWLRLHFPLVDHQHSVCWVSGGARGIDQAVHRLAVDKNSPTLVFLPSGHGELFPDSLVDFIPRVLAAGGAVVSEFSWSQGVRRASFHQRNRLISGVAAATLIVEGHARSGTLITARFAAEQSRSVYVVPGHPLEDRFHGNLRLLQEGATMVFDAHDLNAFLDVDFQSAKGPGTSHGLYPRLSH